MRRDALKTKLLSIAYKIIFDFWQTARYSETAPVWCGYSLGICFGFNSPLVTGYLTT